MSKLTKLFKGLSLLFQRPSLINTIIESTEVQREEVISNFNCPQGLKQINLLDLFPDFQTNIQPFSFLEGGSLPTDLALLKLLATKTNQCVYFEIGTWRGESVANVAANAAKCYTLNLSENELTELGMNKEYIRQHAMFSKHLANVEHLEGNSLRYDFSAFKNKIDLVFIDGDHHFESVKSDTKSAFTLLKGKESVIVWHDYLNHSNEIRWEVLNGILSGTPHSEARKNIYHVSNTLCAIYYPFPIQSKVVEETLIPDKVFEINLKAKAIS